MLPMIAVPNRKVQRNQTNYAKGVINRTPHPEIALSLIRKYAEHVVTYFFSSVALRPNAGHGLLILEVFSRSHTTTHHSR